MKRPVYNDLGFMAIVSDDYARRAIARGELVEDDEGVLRVIPQDIREATGAERRRRELEKQKKQREGRR